MKKIFSSVKERERMLIARRLALQEMLKAVLQKYDTRQNLGCTLKIGEYKKISK